MSDDQQPHEQNINNEAPNQGTQGVFHGGVHIYHGPAPEPPEEPLPEVDCPYRGLRAFEAEHHHLFFGRDATTAALVQHVDQHPFTAVVGPSGSGKSSLVRAGLQYAFQQRDALTGLITPGRDPLRALAARLVDWLSPRLSKVGRLKETRELHDCLRDDTLSIGEVLARIHERHPQCPLLLLVDQFEEVYTQGIAPEVQARYLALLLAIGDYDGADPQAPTRLVLALRADFYDHVLRDRALGAAVGGDYNDFGCRVLLPPRMVSHSRQTEETTTDSVDTTE